MICQTGAIYAAMEKYSMTEIELSAAELAMQYSFCLYDASLAKREFVYSRVYKCVLDLMTRGHNWFTAEQAAVLEAVDAVVLFDTGKVSYATNN